MKTGRSEAFAALGLSVAALLLVIGISGGSNALNSFFAEPVRNRYSSGNLFSAAGILVLTGTGALLSLGSGMFNLGGEGQAYVGAFIGTVTALFFQNIGSPYTGFPAFFAACASAFISGSVMAGVSAFMKNRFNVDELLTSFLLSGASLPLVDYFITGPARDPDSYLLTTRQIAEPVRFSSLLPPSQFNIGFFIALGFAAFFI